MGHRPCCLRSLDRERSRPSWCVHRVEDDGNTFQEIVGALASRQLAHVEEVIAAIAAVDEANASVARHVLGRSVHTVFSPFLVVGMCGVERGSNPHLAKPSPGLAWNEKRAGGLAKRRKLAPQHSKFRYPEEPLSMPIAMTPGMQQLYDLPSREGDLASLDDAAFVETVFKGGGQLFEGDPFKATREGSLARTAR